MPETTEAFLNLLGKRPEEARICLINTASLAHHPKGDAPYIEEGKRRLSDLGFRMITEIDLRNEIEGSLNDKFNHCDVILVGGGNTFYLMKYVNESGFAKALKSFLDRGGIYFGISAGSYITCPDISMAQWKHADDQNTVGLKDLRGLGLVNFYVSSHYVPVHEAIINENKNKVSCPIFALTDLQAILVDNEKIQFIGPGGFKQFK